MSLKLLDNKENANNLAGAPVEEYCWTIAYPPDKNGNISKVLGLAEYCRESLIASTFGAMSWKKKDNPERALKGKNGRCYLVFICQLLDEQKDYWHDDESVRNPKKFRETLRLKLRTATKILNEVEKKAKWPKSRLVFPINPWRETMDAAIFRVSNKWFFSPYMISLLVLILRSSLFTRAYLCKNTPSVASMKNRFKSRKGRYAWSECNETREYAEETFEFWIPILTNFSRLHKGTTLEYNFSFKNYSIDGHCRYNGEGISTLVDGRSAHPIIGPRFDELYKEVIGKPIREKNEIYTC